MSFLRGLVGILIVLWGSVGAGLAATRLPQTVGVQSVTLSSDASRLLVQVASPPNIDAELVELQPYQSDEAAVDAASLASIVHEDAASGELVTIDLPRYQAGRDRLDSRFFLVAQQQFLGAGRYVERLAEISRDRTPLPRASSKKGLQVQMLDDAIALGIQHATLNVDLAGLVDVRQRPGSVRFESNGRTFHFLANSVANLDRQVQTLTKADVQVYLILLNYLPRDPQTEAVMRHPDSPEVPPNRISAFNFVTEEGVAWFRATVEFLADRYCDPTSQHGRVVGYIVGNEVNSHSQWYALGPALPAAVADHYHRNVRVVHSAVRKASAEARVYISLDHYWTGAMSRDRRQSCGGKELLDELTRLSRAGGDFDWHVAHHPYPENLFEPRSWLDKAPQNRPETPKITFKNLEQLTAYLSREDMLCQGDARRVILSEQGFHTPDTAEGEDQQAAGFAYAWVKVQRLAGIDAFILHRHVDHGREGGLNLGLWTRQRESIATPDRQKRIYDVFRVADTDDWARAFEFALPLIGVQDWADVK